MKERRYTSGPKTVYLIFSGSHHFSPGDIQFQLVYDRGRCAESSYLNVCSKNDLRSRATQFRYFINLTSLTQGDEENRTR